MTSATNNASVVVKITYGTDIRRFTTPSDTLTWTSLGKRVADSFDLAQKTFKLTYIDDENDRITLSSDEELAEAVGLARVAAPPVLRLAVHPHDAAPPADATANPANNIAPPEIAPFIEQLVEQLPVAMASLPSALRQMLPHAELDVAATVAANQPAQGVHESARPDTFCPPDPHGPGATPNVHEGVTCDKSGMSPIVGNRYHLVGHNYDLCEAEFEKLSDKEKRLFRKVLPPDESTRRFPGCGRAVGGGIHPGVECDRTGMSPIVGVRYHLRGHDYDLCQEAFDKLPAVEKGLYDAIPPPPQMNSDTFDQMKSAAAAAAAGMPWRPAHCGWRARGPGCRMAEGPNGFNGANGCAKLAARFVRDVTIFDGTQMSPGTAFTKIWRIKNVGEVPWPAGTKMIFVGGDQMTTEMNVPLSRGSPVSPGEEVDVAVEMVAPLEHGRYLGYWRLTGPHGRRKFGQRVWCHIQVVDPSQEAVFMDDPQATLDEIERKKQSLAATEADPDADAADAADAAEPLKTELLAGAPDPKAENTNPKNTNPKGTDLKVGTDPKAPAIPGETAPAAAPTDAATDAAIALKDGDQSDDGEMVEAVAEPAAPTEPGPSAVHAVDTPPPPAAAEPSADPKNEPKNALLAMGFVDAGMIETVLAKNGDDIEACARDLAAASEWDSLLEDLEEMGFTNRELNQSLMLKHAGNIKRTVKDLVEA